VLGWSSITVFAAHGPANIVIGQSDFTANACNAGGVGAATLCALATPPRMYRCMR
jgi:hypothetical protein